MPRVNIDRFWGLLRDGVLYEVHRGKAAATRAKATYKPGSKHQWAVVPVQVVYN